MFLSCYVDDLKMAGEEKGVENCWRALGKVIDLDPPQNLSGNSYLGVAQQDIETPMDLGTIGKKLRGGSYMMVMDMVGRRRRRRRRWFYRSFRSSPLAIDESFLAVLLALLYSCPRLANSLIYLL